MEYIDLHLHSNCSDGTMTPAELVRAAVKAGIRGVSITDHDTVEGTEQALEEGKKQGIEIVAGVEMSAYLDDTPLHILGYGFRHNDPLLLEWLVQIQAARNARNEGILAKLKLLGIQVTGDELRSYSPTGQTGRPHIAGLLVDKKVVKSMDEAFSRYLGRSGLAYVERRRLNAAEAIAMITAAAGIAVLAHPLTIDPTMATLPAVLAKMKELGLGGVEGYYAIYSKTIRRKISELSRELGLLVTGGSDYHGETRSGTCLGGCHKNQRAPYELLVALNGRLRQAATTPGDTAGDHEQE